MKKVITALLNENVNEKLQQYEEINVFVKDIQYQEGILEVLQIQKEIDFIILSELLPGQYNIKQLIEEIKKLKNDIKIILILEKENKELENFLLSKGNIFIYYNNKIEIKDIAEKIIQKKQKEDLEKEIEEIKKLICEKEQKDKEEKNNKIEKEEKIKIEEEIKKEYNEKFFKENLKTKIFKIIKKENTKKDCKIFFVAGTNGIGKSIFTIQIAKQLSKMKKKILIIDLDFFNNSIKILLGIKNKKEKNKISKQENYFQDKTSFKQFIFSINSKIDLLSDINLLIGFEEEIQTLKIIEEIKTKYDVIIIDTEIRNEENFLNLFIRESDKIIFLTEPNILQMKKAKNLLKQYENNFGIEKEKINLIFNKVKNDSISLFILKDIFKQYNILGKINFIKNYNTFINQNLNEMFLEPVIKKQYKKIAKEILKNSKLKKYYLDKME